VSIRADWCFTSTNLTHAQLTGTDPSPLPAPNTTTLRGAIMNDWPTVTEGATGQHVRDVQALLNAHGASLLVDGLDGPKTTAALQTFQAEHHVPNSVRADGTGDGQAGPMTILALLDL
jgi:peptidoglycan hydrolase-like protein with peptidoglycan-binding domain